MPRGRPRKPRHLLRAFRFTLRLWVGEDDDLIAFFEKVPSGRRAAALKTALRSGTLGKFIIADSPTDDELSDMADDFLF
jgi:hypothetical protein